MYVIVSLHINMHECLTLKEMQLCDICASTISLSLASALAKHTRVEQIFILLHSLSLSPTPLFV